MNNLTRTKRNKGFTLIEVLVVMAISMILMGLVMYPVLQSFRLTSRAKSMVEAQDSARQAMEQISREIGEAMDVLDFEAYPVDIQNYVIAPDDIQDWRTRFVEVPVYNADTGKVYWRVLKGSKIDLTLPKMSAHCNNPDHDDSQGPRDFVASEDLAAPICPVCGQPTTDFRPKLPIEQSNVVVRYFLGLKYNNLNPDPQKDTPPHGGWQSPWGDNVGKGEGNQIVLYRIEFNPNDAEVFGTDLQTASLRLQLVLRDPGFFYRDSYSQQMIDDLKIPFPVKPWGSASNEPLWKVWARKARIIGLGKYEDLAVGAEPDNNGDFAVVEPTVYFNYSRVDKDTFTGVNFGDTSSETPDSVPTVFRSMFGYWTPNSVVGVTSPFGVSVYRYAYGADPNNPKSPPVLQQDKTTSYVSVVSGSNTILVEKRVNGVLDAGADTFDMTDYMTKGYYDFSTLGYYSPGPEMAYYFDYSLDFSGNPVLNLNRGSVFFTLKVKDFVLSSSDLDAINTKFENDYIQDRGTAKREITLPAMSKLKYATIVPGSEVVSGPNMYSGPNYGVLVRYTRVPFNLGVPEFNQYAIDYNTGLLRFSSIFDQKLPVKDANGNDCASMTVQYKIQFNRDGDVVQGSYQTKAKINIHLGIRMFDPESAEPHMVELNNVVKVRNAYR